jgi:type III secretion protein J
VSRRNRTDSSARGLVLAVAVLMGCEAAVESGLEESEANAIVVALHEAQIGARKEADPGGEERFQVMVPTDDVGAALERMREEGLPRPQAPGFEEMFGEGGLVPTATEEQARYVAALGGELSSSIEAMEGVLDARVHVALPDRRRIALDEQAPRPRASVLIRHRGARPAYSDEAVQALVAGAVQDMAPTDVAVVGVPVEIREASRGERLVSVGPITVTRGSATSLKAILGGALALHVLLAGLLVWVVRRRRAVAQVSAEAEVA